MNDRWIKASEIGEYLYCQRAWWYRLQGAESVNVRELAQGTQLHAQHGRGLLQTNWQRMLAYVLIILAIFLFLLQILL